MAILQGGGISVCDSLLESLGKKSHKARVGDLEQNCLLDSFTAVAQRCCPFCGGDNTVFLAGFVFDKFVLHLCVYR